jgi:molybdopterin-guanine dinucleotide biosynthesis protein B
MSPPVFGIVGWKNSGKTTLTARLITELTLRGFKVAAAKHTHHSFDMDHPGRDSYRFAEAGARAVAVVSATRVAFLQELHGEPEPDLAEIVARLSGSGADLVLVEGFKQGEHAKIEVRRNDAREVTPLAGTVPGIVAIAAEYDVDGGGLPVFRLDDVGAIADFILEAAGVETRP